MSGLDAYSCLCLKIELDAVTVGPLGRAASALWQTNILSPRSASVFCQPPAKFQASGVSPLPTGMLHLPRTPPHPDVAPRWAAGRGLQLSMVPSESSHFLSTPVHGR